MSKQSEILYNTLEAVNKNNAIIVSFSNREKIIIKKMMEQYAKEVVQASLEKASEKTSLIENETSYVKQSEINVEENIVLL